MIAGLLITETTEKECSLAFLSDTTETCNLETNPDIVDEIKKNSPEIIAVDVSEEQSHKEFTGGEEDLLESGYSFTPSSSETKKIKRLQALKAALEQSMDNPPEFIRFDPHITSKELALDSDNALKSIGVDPETIGSSKEFDAVLGAVTARFYQQNQYRDLGVIVPKPLND